MFVDAVLGLSMTPTSFGLVLVEGQDADGATMDREAFDVEHGPIHTSEQATAAVLRTEASAANRGVRLHSIGLTWSEDAGDQASQLMQSLSESGFDNVVAIRLPEATEALARGMAEVIGYETTAVCVVEPETMITLIVHTDSGAVQTAFNHAIDSEETLIRWLSTVFTRADWQPQALVIVGSAGGFDDEFPCDLEDALSVPVFSPAEAELALARGAALASTVTVEPPFDAFAVSARPDRGRGAGPRASALLRRPSAQAGALTMLVAGVLTFVVSASVAVTLEMSPHERSGPVRPAGAVEVPRAPAPEASPTELPAAPVVSTPPPAAPVEEAPVVEAPPVEVPEEAPAPEVPTADEAPPVAVAPDPIAAPAPAYSAPQPLRKPTLRSRIMDKLRGTDDGGAAEQTDPVPGAMPPG